MNILDKLIMSSASDRILEEQIYLEVSKEIQQGAIRAGLWIKALEKSNGDENKAKSKYISLRVQSIKDEISILKRAKENALKESIDRENAKRKAQEKWDEKERAEKIKETRIKYKEIKRREHLSRKIVKKKNKEEKAKSSGCLPLIICASIYLLFVLVS